MFIFMDDGCWIFQARKKLEYRIKGKIVHNVYALATSLDIPVQLLIDVNI